MNTSSESNAIDKCRLKKHSKTSSTGLEIYKNAHTVNRLDVSSGNKAEYEATLMHISHTLHSCRGDKQRYAMILEDATQELRKSRIILNDRFLLTSILGIDATGTLYNARDFQFHSTTKRHSIVTIKVLNEEFIDHSYNDSSLRNEVFRACQLSHSNIVSMDNLNRDGKIIYLTMEALSGQSLEQLLNQNRKQGIPPKSALRIIQAYCKALSHAHKRNIIHGFLKPSNIFIDKAGTKVLDLGLANIVNNPLDNADLENNNKQKIASFKYSSLEHLNDHMPHTGDDVYSAAVIAYEMLSGRHPYDGKSAREALAEGLEPKRINKLSNVQWQALAASLKPRRSERTQNIDTFSKGLTKASRYPIIFSFCAIVLIAALTLIYGERINRDFMTTEADKRLQVGQQCFARSDFECAINEAKYIISISPQHANAKLMLERAKKNLLKTELE